MASTGKLKLYPLFVGLTRPPMVFGVTYMMVALNGLTGMIYMINTADILGFFGLVIVMHVIGYIICFYEPLYIDLWMVKARKCMKCKNKRFHGGKSSYEVF